MQVFSVLKSSVLFMQAAGQLLCFHLRALPQFRPSRVGPGQWQWRRWTSGGLGLDVQKWLCELGIDAARIRTEKYD